MESEWITALASVGALALSAGLGAWSIRMTLQEKAAARAERISEGTRVYIDVKLISTREVSISLHNTSSHPIQNVIAAAHPYESSSGQAIASTRGGSPPTVTVNEGFLPPHSVRTFKEDIGSLRYENLHEFHPWAWFGYFHDHEGRAWVHHASGKVQRRSEFTERDEPPEGPLTIEADKTTKS